jgi:hypothetical protein
MNHDPIDYLLDDFIQHFQIRQSMQQLVLGWTKIVKTCNSYNKYIVEVQVVAYMFAEDISNQFVDYSLAEFESDFQIWTRIEAENVFVCMISKKNNVAIHSYN